MSDALQRLIEAVEAGSDAPFHDLTYSQLDTFGQRFIDLTQQANRGDLNAALGLHADLVPQWDWCVGAGPIQGSKGCANMMGWQIGEVDTVEADNPARALLLAILRAYQQVQQ